MDNPNEDGLPECREVVAHLLEEKQDLENENQVLRVSAETFGELAERLSRRSRKGVTPRAQTPE